jgi:hypothetical protein
VVFGNVGMETCDTIVVLMFVRIGGERKLFITPKVPNKSMKRIMITDAVVLVDSKQSSNNNVTKPPSSVMMMIHVYDKQDLLLCLNFRIILSSLLLVSFSF